MFPEHIQISLEALIGVVFLVVIPILLFWWRLHNLTLEIRDMHHAPDEHGFGTTRTNELLAIHMENEEEMQRKTLDALKYLTHTIRELTHYVRWMSEQQTEKKPPPFVRNGKPPS